MRGVVHNVFGWSTKFSVLAKRRPLPLLVGFFAAAVLVGAACRDQLPTEVLDPRFSVSLPGEGPSLATDKDDYAPGETVVITGSGWGADEVVRLEVIQLDAPEAGAPVYEPWDVTADENGEIAATWVVPEEAAGATLKLTADGQTSGAHAELIFTDLQGAFAIFSDAGLTTSRTAYAWNATIYPRLTGASSGSCYRIQWRNPSSVAVQTNTFGPGLTAYNSTTTPALPSFTVPATGPSGVWSILLEQSTSGNCAGPFDASPGNPVLFDVARAVVYGAGTSTSFADDPGGDNDVRENAAATVTTQNGADRTIYVQSQSGANRRSFLRFDLSAASPGALPAGVLITEAKVRLMVAGTPGTVRSHRMQRAAATWAEGTITWNNQPAVDGAGAEAAATVPDGTGLAPTAPGGDNQTFVRWTVTADAQHFHNTPAANHGWRIKDNVEGGSPNATTRYFGTEATTTCSVGTTCKRQEPVLLIDYSDPPKLAFVTGPFTGVVGECIGPMRVQSRDFGGSPLVVGADLTINLTTDAASGFGDIFATAGEGHFYNDATCATNTVPPKILSTQHTSQNFWYRASHRGDGSHKLTAAATGYTPNAEQTQTINKTPTTVIYTGDPLIFSGNTLTMKAALTSSWPACEYGGTSTPGGRRVKFVIDPDPTDGSGDLQFAFVFTNQYGVATRTTGTSGWMEGIFDITANAIDNDDCDAGKDNAALAILLPGNAATGGGFLAGSKVGGGRANFGFNVRPVEGSNPLTYKGQFLLIRQNGGVPQFRCKGYLNEYGSTDHDNNTATPNLNAASGRCDFQVWDAALNSDEGGWVVPSGYGYTNRPFTIYFIDNGSGKGKTAPPPDEFGFQISFVGTVTDPSFPVYDPNNPTHLTEPINGGNIDVKTDGTNSTTTGGTGDTSTGTGDTGGTTKPGGKKK